MEWLTRTEMLLGSEAMEKLNNASVAVFGIGGVGSFIAEALARSGVGRLALIDSDNIDVTNINRQIHATKKTVGISKVTAMRQRIADIDSGIEVMPIQRLYNAESSDEIFSQIGRCDYIVDAIDMVSSKLHLIVTAKSRGIRIISSMGAGNKLNPAMFEVADIYETSVCPLAKVMRRELRALGIDHLKVVYSKEEPRQNYRPPGSIAFVPSVAGLIMAGEIVKDVVGNDPCVVPK